MKYSRQAKILELIERLDIDTQEELADRLKKEGVLVTQATVSRDIKELRLIKVMNENSKYKYASISNDGSIISEKLLTILQQAYISSDYANNLVVIKTLPGMASAVASTIDALNWSDIIGSIAGDDTIMVVCRAEKLAEELVNKFSKMAKG